ncbi:MAG TPA: hypothetical protein VIT20_07740 [Propionibacteriaceae bacterium]
MTDSTPGNFTRRAALRTGAVLGVAAPLGAVGWTAEADQRSRQTAAPNRNSLRQAVSFLQLATDAYATSGKRFVQSYYDGSGLGDIGFIYDNALTTIALLAAGDYTRAQGIGDGLLFAQANDAAKDGRLRQAYHADTFVNPDGSPHYGYEFGLVGTAVGDMSWTGLALAQLARRTGKSRFLAGAVRIGEWIVDNTYSTTGLKGYTFGETAGLEDHKSTEHNIDVYALFTLLHQLTKDAAWKRYATHAWNFVEAVWNADDGFFWTGSDDGAAINKNPLQLPLDVQTWSWLAARKEKYAGALDWARTNLATTDNPLRTNSALTGNYSVRGVGFASGTFRTDVTKKIGGQDYNPLPDSGGVWFEGTGQLALSLGNRNRGSDRARADGLLDNIRSAQNNLGTGQTFGGKDAVGGVVAASSPIDTGFGFGYYQHRHTAATSWYVFALTGFNPYVF